jgi:hypothetical protein
MMVENLLMELAVVGAEIINEAIREVRASYEVGRHVVPEAFIVGVPELRPYYEESSVIKEHMSFDEFVKYVIEAFKASGYLCYRVGDELLCYETLKAVRKENKN